MWTVQLPNCPLCDIGMRYQGGYFKCGDCGTSYHGPVDIEFLGDHGWPVERIKGRPVTNLIRLLFHTRKIQLNRDPATD